MSEVLVYGYNVGSIVKKIRITVNKESKGKKFPIFNSPESLYVWLNDPELKDSQKLDSSLGSYIVLKSGEVMEIEWMGCEYFNEKNQHFRVDQIRLAKTIKTPTVNNVVGIYEGWIVEEIISFKNNKDENIKTTKLTPKSKHRFDIEELFFSRGLSKEEKYKIEPQDLH